ncbi:MAG: DUF2997 domain-containing protein [Crocinitomicaceae bacterium]
MAEERIVITIDENGKINASTEGVKGDLCLDQLQELLSSLEELQSIIKTDEFYQTNELKSQNKIQNRKQ